MSKENSWFKSSKLISLIPIIMIPCGLFDHSYGPVHGLFPADTLLWICIYVTAAAILTLLFLPKITLFSYLLCLLALLYPATLSILELLNRIENIYHTLTVFLMFLVLSLLVTRANVHLKLLNEELDNSNTKKAKSEKSDDIDNAIPCAALCLVYILATYVDGIDHYIPFLHNRSWVIFLIHFLVVESSLEILTEFILVTLKELRSPTKNRLVIYQNSVIIAISCTWFSIETLKFYARILPTT